MTEVFQEAILETIMAEQSLLDNTPTPTVTKALTEDLALVDQGIITVMEALSQPQSDEKCLAYYGTVANKRSGPQLSDDLLNMVREGLISMADATMMQVLLSHQHPNDAPRLWDSE